MNVEVILAALTAPVNVAAPAFTAFDVALKKEVLSEALTFPFNVPETFTSPVATFNNTVLSLPMIFAFKEVASMLSVTLKKSV